MNEQSMELLRRTLGSALVFLARARGKYLRDDDLARAADALDRAAFMAGCQADSAPTDQA